MSETVHFACILLCCSLSLRNFAAPRRKPNFLFHSRPKILNCEFTELA